MLALCLAREDAVKEWRKILGPKEVDIAAQEAPESYVKSSPLTLQTLYIQSDFFVACVPSLHWKVLKSMHFMDHRVSKMQRKKLSISSPKRRQWQSLNRLLSAKKVYNYTCTIYIVTTIIMCNSYMHQSEVVLTVCCCCCCREHTCKDTGGRIFSFSEQRDPIDKGDGRTALQ